MLGEVEANVIFCLGLDLSVLSSDLATIPFVLTQEPSNVQRNGWEPLFPWFNPSPYRIPKQIGLLAICILVQHEIWEAIFLVEILHKLRLKPSLSLMRFCHPFWPKVLSSRKREHIQGGLRKEGIIPLDWVKNVPTSATYFWKYTFSIWIEIRVLKEMQWQQSMIFFGKFPGASHENRPLWSR